MAKPNTVPASVVNTMLRLRNSPIGIRGSFTRSSVNTNSTALTAATAARVRMKGEFHAYCVPPHVVVRIKQVVAMTISVVPT